MRKIHIFIAFFVLLPIGFAYLYYSNVEIIAMLIDTDDKKEPEAKHPSVFLLIIFWIMVGNISTIFLMLNTILMGATLSVVGHNVCEDSIAVLPACACLRLVEVCPWS